MGLDIVELVIEVETVFGVQVPDDDAARLRTVGDLYDYVARHLGPAVSSTGGPYEGELWERYLEVVEREAGVDRTKLRPESRFVEDLNLD